MSDRRGYTPTIGLEIHAELKTKTKMFCNSRNNPDETRPNVNTCPVCLAHPGTLPVINKEAVRHVLRVGAAVGGELADYTEFDRKSYFYPDIPKGYQISQYEYPLVKGGVLNNIAITRIHLEEDTARSTHQGDKSLVDFNRAGVPLMELVTEPVIHTATEAGDFARELQLLLRTLGAGEANLEKGEMRVEANISVSKDDSLGTKVEVKNLNSFKAVEKAIEYEIDRHIALLEKGEKVIQETRGWNEDTGQTFSQRLKEGSADYRYFPDPDLPKLRLSEIPECTSEAIQKGLPELPWQRRARYESTYQMKSADSKFVVGDAKRIRFIESVLILLSEKEEYVVAINYFVSDLKGEEGKVTPDAYAKLVRMLVANKISSRGGKDILTILKEEGGDPEVIAEEKNLLQISDPEALREVIRSMLKEEENVVAEYKAGKESSLQYLIGKGMKATKGAGNPSTIRDLILEQVGK